MGPTTATRVRFFEAKRQHQQVFLGPPNVRTVQELGLKDKPGARIGFEVKGTVIYARERTARGSGHSLVAIHRSRNRKSAAEAALRRLEKRVNKLPPPAVTTDVIVQLNKVRKQITKWGTVSAQDLQLLFDEIYFAEDAHAKQTKAAADKLRFDKAVKGAAQLVMADAPLGVFALPLNVVPAWYDAASSFKAFILQACRRDENPPNYALAGEFVKCWIGARPEDVACDTKTRHLIDSLVKLVMKGCGMEVPAAEQLPILRYKWDDDKSLCGPMSRQRFGSPKPLGKGGNASAHVYSSGSGVDTVTAVVKKLYSGDQALSEAQMHAKAKRGGSGHIVDLLGTVADPDGGHMLVLQHAQNGDASSIEQHLQARLRAGLDPKAAHDAFMTMFADMLKGVAQAHSNGVMHLDLKPENFFVDKDGQLLLGDFGTACDNLVQSAKSPVDSPDFSAPELVNSIIENRAEVITYKADIWSLGVILYEFNSPRFAKSGPDTSPRQLRPFPYGSFTSDAHTLIRKFTAHDNDRYAQLDLDPENALHRLVIQMLDPDPTKRPSAEAVLEHPLIAPYAKPNTKLQAESVRRARTLILEPKGNALPVG